MHTENLAFVAEALLALCDNDDRAPFYSERNMRRREDLASRRDPLHSKLARAQATDSLLDGECRDVVQSARLTDRQLEIVNLRLEGYTFEEIGRKRGCTKQGVQHVFVQALKKLDRAFDVYPYRGLSEIYRFEVRRGLPRRAFGRMTA